MVEVSGEVSLYVEDELKRIGKFGPFLFTCLWFYLHLPLRVSRPYGTACGPSHLLVLSFFKLV